jgi:hypothetical protein
MTGAAMSLLKKCEVINRLPASRDKNQESFGPVRYADEANSLQKKRGGARASRLSFIEDYILEHSLHGSVRHITASESLGFF